jgi:hypothetical protein
VRILAIIGALMTVAGLAGLGYCIREGFRMRSDPKPADETRRRLGFLLAVNFGSVALAALGLGLVAAGLILD